MLYTLDMLRSMTRSLDPCEHSQYDAGLGGVDIFTCEKMNVKF